MNPYPKNTKIFALFEQIKQNEELHILLPNNNENYFPPGSTHLHKCVVKTKSYPFLNNYIKCYLKQIQNDMCNIINAQDKLGDTPLMVASKCSRSHSSIETVKILLKYGANIDTRGSFGGAALALAIESIPRCSTLNTIKLLIKYNVNVNIRDTFGRTPLMINYWFSKSKKITKLLLKNNADVNMQDYSGYTALMFAIKFETHGKQTISLLLEHGANMNLKTNCNNNAITLAFSKDENIIQYLLPNRKIFIEKTLENKKQILHNKTSFWKVEQCDFKLIYVKNFMKLNNIMIFDEKVENYQEILKFL